jgi:hypothetical protein
MCIPLAARSFHWFAPAYITLLTMASAIYIPLSSAAYTVEIDSVPRYAVKQVFRSGTTAADPT